MVEILSTHEADSDSGKLATKDLLRRHLVAVAVASIAVAATFSVATTNGNQLVTKPEFGGGQAETLGVWLVVGATALFGGVVGAAFALGISKFARNPRRTFFGFSVLGLVIYGFLAFIRAETVETAVWLNIMHLVAAVPIVGALLSGMPRNRRVRFHP